jgi:hypothetical protein
MSTALAPRRLPFRRRASLKSACSSSVMEVDSGEGASELVTTWRKHPKRKRWHLHFTPTSSSWLNLFEGWFSILTQRRLKKGHLDLPRRSDHGYRDLGGALERRPHAIRVEEDGRRDRGQGAPRASATGFSDGPLAAPMGQSACAGRHLLAGDSDADLVTSSGTPTPATIAWAPARRPFAIARLLLVTMDGWHQSAPM